MKPNVSISHEVFLGGRGAHMNPKPWSYKGHSGEIFSFLNQERMVTKELPWFVCSSVSLFICHLHTSRFLDMRGMERSLFKGWQCSHAIFLFVRNVKSGKLTRLLAEPKAQFSLHHRPSRSMSLLASGRVRSQIPAAWHSVIHIIDISAT